MSIYTYMQDGNIQQNPLCAASSVIKDLHISPRFSPTIFCRDANSILLRVHLCTAVGSRYAQNPVFEIVHQESVKDCSIHHVVVKNNSRGSMTVIVQLV